MAIRLLIAATLLCGVVLSKKKEFKTSSHFKRIKEWEVVKVSHSQLHNIDDSHTPFYPNNAVVEFSAHNTHFRVLLRKNHGLFADNFAVTSENKLGIVEHLEWKDSDHCFYHGDVIINGTLSTHKQRNAGVHMTLCKGWGVRGSVYIDGEVFTIVPHRFHVDIERENDFLRKHRLDHTHMVYKESSVSHDGMPTKWCGHSFTGHESDGLHAHEHEHEHQHEHGHNEPHGHKRRLQTTTRYVEMLIVNDPARVVDQFNNDTVALRDHTITLVNEVSVRYRNADFGAAIGDVVVVLSHIKNWETFPSGFGDPQLVQQVSAGNTNPTKVLANCQLSTRDCYKKAVFGSSGQLYEVAEDDYLTKFNSWQLTGANVPPHDNAQLLSYYDFWASVVGFAGVSAMCNPARSGGIDQATYSDGFSAATIAHEMGHNWGMRHDGQSGNACSPSGDIMASIASLGSAANSFSSCSVQYIQTFFAAYNPVCVDNVPTSTTFADCGNGLKEDGESCDCGSADCATLDPCCDGSLCQIFFDASCSASDSCCDASTCSLKTNGTVCRPLDPNNPCDIAAEQCSGGVECPPDKFHNEGTTCTFASDGKSGMCYQGGCVSWNKQCQASSNFNSAQAPFESCAATDPNHSAACDNLECHSVAAAAAQCDFVAAGVAKVQDGVPCGTNLQCKNKACGPPELSARWIAESFSTCSPACKAAASDPAGLQTRNVFCARQDGTRVGPGNCTGLEQPVSNQTCNDYQCDFCGTRLGGNPPCGTNGVCNPTQNRCECNPGYGGANCNEAPGFEALYITSKAHSLWTSCDAYVSVSGQTPANCTTICNTIIDSTNELLNSTQTSTNANTTTCSCAVRTTSVYQTVTDRVDPNDMLGNVSSTCQFKTVRQTTVSSLDALPSYTFDRGDFVTVRFNSSGAIRLVAITMEDLSKTNYQWPFYVGGRLAPNQTTCIDADPNFADLTCDFEFQIPSDLVPGDYRIQVKFNNEPRNTIFSRRITINCNSDACAFSNGGTCTNPTDATCTCATGYSGPTCSESACGAWTLDSLSAGSTSNGVTVPRCSQGSATCTAANAIGATPGRCDCGIHWTGPYCELPADGCTGLATAACNADPMCTDNGGTCVYKHCFDVGTAGGQQLCDSTNTTGLALANRTWECKWDTTNMFCARRICPTQPACQLNTIRRPLAGVSICDSWYCDCSTMSNFDTTFISEPTLDDVLSVANKTAILTCAVCALNCTNGAKANTNCTACTGCAEPYRGPLCDSLYWIGVIDVSTSHVLTTERKSEYEKALTQDLSYVFSFTDTARLGLDQTKPSGTGSTVFFYITWPTTDVNVAQAEGGWRMKAFSKLVASSQSEVYRGSVTNETDSAVAFSFCLPYYENCDPSKQLDILVYLIYCSVGGFGLVLLGVILYFIFCRHAVEHRQSVHIEEHHAHALERHPSRRNRRTLGRPKSPWHHEGLPEDSYKYKKCLFVFNFVTAGFGFTILGMAAVMYSFASQTLLPEWTFWWLIMFGVVAVIIAVLGTIGEITSNETLEENIMNWWLVVLFILTFTTVMTQVVILGWIVLSYDPRGVAATGSLTKNFEDRLKTTLLNQPVKWWEAQKQFSCCGYEINVIPDPLATGKLCTLDATTSAAACKPKLWATVSNSFLQVLAFVAIFLLSQCSICWSSLCLACCIESKDFALTGHRTQMAAV